MQNFAESVFLPEIGTPTVRLKGFTDWKTKACANLFRMCLCAAFVCASLQFQEARGSAICTGTQTVSCESRSGQDLHSVVMPGLLALIRKEKKARICLQSRTEESYYCCRRQASPDMRDVGTVPCHLFWPSTVGMKKAWKVGSPPWVTTFPSTKHQFCLQMSVAETSIFCSTELLLSGRSSCNKWTLPLHSVSVLMSSLYTAESNLRDAVCIICRIATAFFSPGVQYFRWKFL